MILRAPYLSLARAGFVACVIVWDPETGEFTRREGGPGLPELRQRVIPADLVHARLP